MHLAALNRHSDEELVALFATERDEGAIRILVERHQERIFGYLLGMVRNRDVANDLFQDTFFRVLSALRKERASYTHQGRFLGWVLRIARNATLDYLRTRKRWQDVDDLGSDEGSSYWDSLPDDSPSADVSIDHSNQLAQLEACIEKLPPEQREVVLLRQESELTFREIAALTDCSINTALGRMRYALINLKRMMADNEALSQDH